MQKQVYRFWIEEEQHQHNVGPWRKYLWLDQDRKVVFVDKHAGQEWLVVVDLSEGLEKARIRKGRIEWEKIVDGIQIPPPAGVDPDTWRKEGAKHLQIKELKYTDGKVMAFLEPDERYTVDHIELDLPEGALDS